MPKKRKGDGIMEAQLEVCDLADDWHRRGIYDSESVYQELLRAILHRAILDLTDSAKEIRREARAFFLRSQIEPYEPFSFQWIAEYLSLDFNALRAKLGALNLLSFEDAMKDPEKRLSAETRNSQRRPGKYK